jgi:glycosyltransferase involved in cell wall biosynthesis
VELPLTDNCHNQLVMKTPLVSVLTPVYNGEKYLAQCIESVLAQTYTHWEYIVINNCSTDRTLAIAESCAGRDSRIRIHNHDRLVSMMENHNVAVGQISAGSKYCKMLHADDWLFPECLARMVECAEADPSVGVVGSYGLKGIRVAWDGLPFSSAVIKGRDVCRRTLLGNLYVFGSPSSTLMRSDLIRTRKQFYETHELNALWFDQHACFDLLQESNFGFVHQVLTFTRVHDDSITSVADRTGLNQDLPSRLILLKKYGPVYLTDNEYEERLQLLMERYYSFLGQSLLFKKRKHFWDFHRRALGYMGYSLRKSKLLKAVWSEIFDTLINPLRMAFAVITKSKLY